LEFFVLRNCGVVLWKYLQLCQMGKHDTIALLWGCNNLY
jgi:hypothetical protein